MASYAQGKYALAISDRQTSVLQRMVREWNGAWVPHYHEPKQPQLEPKPISADPQGLWRARPARVAFYTCSIRFKSNIYNKFKYYSYNFSRTTPKKNRRFRKIV